MHPSTPPVTGLEIRTRLEANLQGLAVSAPPATGAADAPFPFGTMPAPGHVFLPPPSASARAHANLFCR